MEEKGRERERPARVSLNIHIRHSFHLFDGLHYATLSDKRPVPL